MKKTKAVVTVLIAMVVSLGAFAQNKKPRLSPPDTAKAMIGKTSIEIDYSKPSVKDRTIWGSLVKYDSVWRAGANEATTFETDMDIKVEGQALPAGKYAFFLIPKEKGKWIAIFNNVPNQWGAFKYDQTKDQLRVEVKPVQTSDKMEVLMYHITPDGFSLAWENRVIPVRIKAK